MKISFGSKLRAMRQSANLTMKQLAEGAGVSIATITNLETGGKKPQSRTLEKLKKFLGSDISTFSNTVQSKKSAVSRDFASTSPVLHGSSLEDMMREIDRRGFTVQIGPKSH